VAREYSEFSALKKQVAYAAITASRGFGWKGTAETGFSCLLADQAIPPVTGDCRKDMVITYQASGEVESSTWQVNPWRDWYEPWISRINDALEGFDDLPDPASFDGPIGKLYEAAGQVTASPSTLRPKPRTQTSATPSSVPRSRTSPAGSAPISRAPTTARRCASSTTCTAGRGC
jgi:hypothetical protein